MGRYVRRMYIPSPMSMQATGSTGQVTTVGVQEQPDAAPGLQVQTSVWSCSGGSPGTQTGGPATVSQSRVCTVRHLQVSAVSSQKRSTAARETVTRGRAGQYSKLAAAYYVERRCKHLSHAQAVDFWKRVVNMHNQVLTRQGPDALAAAKSRAIATANASSRCSQNTAKFVRASYRRIKQM